MTMYKSNCNLIIPILALFFTVTSCNFIRDGKAKLAHYCPGLKIDISGISYSFHGGKAAYTIDYDSSSQEAVKTYFENKNNGFTEEKDGDFYDIEMDDKPIIDRSDNILAKAFKHPKGKTEVVFNETTRRIIIIENEK